MRRAMIPDVFEDPLDHALELRETVVVVVLISVAVYTCGRVVVCLRYSGVG